MFYRKISIQTKDTPDIVRRKISDVKNSSRGNTEVEDLLMSNWYVRIDLQGSRFQISIGRKAARFERSGMHSVLKGEIRENNSASGSDISMIVRLADEYLVGLVLVLSLLIVAFFYAMSHSVIPVLIISSILFVVSYTLFLIDFNYQVKRFQRIINSLFNR